MTDLICPISFINEKQSISTDLNELFIAGFRDKICTDYTHSMGLDQIKKTFDYNDLSEQQSAWLSDIAQYEYDAFEDSVISYLICNITDLTINTMILAMQSLKMTNDLIDGNLCQIINELKIRDKITSAVVNIFGDSLVRQDSPYQIFTSISIKMSSLYSLVVSKIFDKYVEMFISSVANASGIDLLFKTLYTLVYDSDNYPKNESYSNMYVFCSSILREAIDNQTINYRLGLIRIANVATNMCVFNPTYGENVYNPNYNTDVNEYNASGLFGTCGLNMISESEDNDN